jgi:hypothetical protein
MRRQYFFPSDDLAEENLHTLRVNRFIQRRHNLGIADLDNNLVLFRKKRIINREAIDVFFVPRVAG